VISYKLFLFKDKKFFYQKKVGIKNPTHKGGGFINF
jgi:hypothetical protein